MRIRSFAVVAVLVLALVGIAQAADDTPTMFTTSYNSAHWTGAQAIAANDIGIVHPASGTVRLGTITATILAYQRGQYAIARTAEGGLLEIEFSVGTWRYTGIEGSAEGIVTAWW